MPKTLSQCQQVLQTPVFIPFTLSFCCILDAGLSKRWRRMKKTWSCIIHWPRVQGQQHSSQRVSIVGGLTVPIFGSGAPHWASLTILASLHLFPAIHVRANPDYPPGPTELETHFAKIKCLIQGRVASDIDGHACVQCLGTLHICPQMPRLS